MATGETLSDRQFVKDLDENLFQKDVIEAFCERVVDVSRYLETALAFDQLLGIKALARLGPGLKKQVNDLLIFSSGLMQMQTKLDPATQTDMLKHHAEEIDRIVRILTAYENAVARYRIELLTCDEDVRHQRMFGIRAALTMSV